MATIKNTLWSNFSKKIRQRNANHNGYTVCISCEKSYPWQETDCGHFIENTERKKDFGGNALWFNPLNFGSQCQGCNRFDAATAKRKWAVKFIRENGEDKYNELMRLKQIPKKWTREEIEEIIDNL